jgi:hypothetical protein
MVNVPVTICVAFFCATLVGYFARLLFASKCNHFNCCWGFVEVDRKTKEESKDIQLQLQMPNASQV